MIGNQSSTVFHIIKNLFLSQVMQLKMARRLQGYSQSAVSQLSFDTGSDYDTDDIEATVASCLIKLTDSMGPEDAGVVLGHAPVRPPRLNEFDSSDGEVFAGPKRRVHKKKRCRSKDDTDKTPTQDSVNKGFHIAVFNDIDSVGDAPCSEESGGSEAMESGVVMESDTANSSVVGSGDSAQITTDLCVGGGVSLNGVAVNGGGTTEVTDGAV